MSSFCFLDAVGRPHLYYSKRSFYFFIFGNSLLLNHSPSEWFYITKRSGLFTTASFLLALIYTIFILFPLPQLFKKYYADPSDQDDLISIGTIGLIKAVSSYKPDKGVRLATYAARCIENAILTPMHTFSVKPLSALY